MVEVTRAGHCGADGAQEGACSCLRLKGAAAGAGNRVPTAVLVLDMLGSAVALGLHAAL
jgi:hypothetical protein